MDSSILRQTALRAANEKAVTINCKLQWFVMVWGRDGECRVYGTEEENLHWSVPELKGAREHYSIPI